MDRKPTSVAMRIKSTVERDNNAFEMHLWSKSDTAASRASFIVSTAKIFVCSTNYTEKGVHQLYLIHSTLIVFPGPSMNLL